MLLMAYPVAMMGVVLAASLAGCVAPAPPPDRALSPPDDAPTDAVVARSNDTWQDGFWEQDPTTAPIPVPRIPGSKVPGEGVLVFVASWTGTVNTGVQLGYSLDDAEVQWLPFSASGEAVEVALEPALAESASPRWAFWWRPSSPVHEDFGGGAGAGSHDIVVLARPARG